MPPSRTIQEVIALVCQLPVEFHRRGNVSPLDLVRESNYHVQGSGIAVQDIQQYLAAHPNLVRDWSGYSDDKRTSSGWYFNYTERLVGYFSGNRCEQEQTFDDVTHACATLIKHELDSISRYI